jgi:hypothetical protein
MTPDREQFERELAQHLSEAAGAPRHDASARIRQRIAATPQRRGWSVRLGALAGSPAWTRAGALVTVAAAALLIGIYIGQVGLPIQVGPSSSPSGSPTADVSPVESGRPEPSALASPAPGVAMSYAVWERYEMPDPEPGLYGGARPSAVVTFGDRYLAVGTLSGCCAGEPSENVGVVWESADGRSWQLVDVGLTFEHASLEQVLAFGDRLVLVGTYAEPNPGGLSTQVGATWVSTDGRTWQRAEGSAPSMVATSQLGLIGASLGTDGVSYFTSADGLGWIRGGTWHDMDRLSAVAATGDRVLVVGTEPGEPLEDGTPTFEVVVWASPDGVNWTGGRAFENAIATSVVAWRDGFAAIVNTYSLAADGSVVGETSVWTSADGLDWEDRGADIGHPSETGMEVFAVGERLVVTVECCGGDLVLVSPAWVSEDGVRWTPIPSQPAFEGSEVVIAAVAETPQGLVAVGRQTESPSLHWAPLAWLASVEPMVWLQPSSERGAEVGEEQPFAMGHCGLRSPIDFDGSLWAPMDRDPTSLEFDSTTGTITLLQLERARFDSDAGDSVTLARLEGAAAYPLCD